MVGASCDEVTPAVPTVTQALCRDGVVGDAAVTVGPTDFITYTFSAEPPYSEGQSVTITATLDPAGGRVGGPILAAWTELTDTTAELVVTFDAVDCIAASLVEPGVDQATCADGCGDGADGDAAVGGVGGGRLHGRSGWAL